MSICIAIIPPKKVLTAIAEASSQYAKHINTKTPKDTWYIPLAYVPAMPAEKSLSQPFLQAVKILSLGEGGDKELWVHVQMTPSLVALRKSFTEDTTPFVPHIYLGSFEQVPPLGIVDTPLAVTFSVEELHILQTDPYEILGTIELTS